MEWKQMMHNEPQPKHDACTNSVVSYTVFFSPAPPVVADHTRQPYHYFSFIPLLLFVIAMTFILIYVN